MGGTNKSNSRKDHAGVELLSCKCKKPQVSAPATCPVWSRTTAFKLAFVRFVLFFGGDRPVGAIEADRPSPPGRRGHLYLRGSRRSGGRSILYSFTFSSFSFLLLSQKRKRGARHIINRASSPSKVKIDARCGGGVGASFLSSRRVVWRQEEKRMSRALSLA